MKTMRRALILSTHGRRSPHRRTPLRPKRPPPRKPVTSPLEFSSSLPALDRVFAWAKEQALAYVFTGDPVGDWYEAALPKREAFCMRDVSHQAAGANALGLAAINKNLFRKFAVNISEAKDWCTYWEINRHDKPAPIDYRNDKEFWYNLPANFDVLDAIGRQYLWTGDRAYLDDPVFLNFYARTVNDYVERWALAPDRIMTRPVIMNLAVPLDPKDPYRVSRGLSSYNEDEEGLNVGADLPAAQYAAYKAYALLLGRRGDAAAAAAWEKKAAEAKAFFHRTWWDPAAGRYFVLHSPDGRFRHGIGQEFLVYFGVTAVGAPTRQAVRETGRTQGHQHRDAIVLSRDLLPPRRGRRGPADDPLSGRSGHEAARISRGLLRRDRRLGPRFDGSRSRRPGRIGGHPIRICPEDLGWAEIKNIPILGTVVSVKHIGRTHTEFRNAGRDRSHVEGRLPRRLEFHRRRRESPKGGAGQGRIRGGLFIRPVEGRARTDRHRGSRKRGEMISFDFETLAGILARWGLRPVRLRPDLEIAGSPERSLSRAALEDADGSIHILESLDPSVIDRKRDIARTIAALHPRLSEARPYLTLPDGDFFARAEGRFWQAAPYVEGAPLLRPDYAGEGRHARPLADLLVRLRTAAMELPERTESSPFSSTLFIRDLERKIRTREPALHARIQPAYARLEESFFPVEAGLPAAFAHGDFHPLNMIWSAEGIRALVDWEFCGMKPEVYDAALLVGCLGMEHPQFLLGDLVMELVARLRRDAGYAERTWAAFFDLVLALRFAWLSDWLRRGDAEMIDLEAAYIGLLHENRGVFRRSWGLPEEFPV